MIQITPQMRILVAVESVDFRKGIDSLAELCRQKLNADPFSGYLFVFRSPGRRDGNPYPAIATSVFSSQPPQPHRKDAFLSRTKQGQFRAGRRPERQKIAVRFLSLNLHESRQRNPLRFRPLHAPVGRIRPRPFGPHGSL